METISLKGRVAIVTGAGNGLGRAHALALAARGARVIVNDLEIKNAERVSDEICSAGGAARPYAASVTNVDAVEAMVADTVEAWQRVDILVNNAGIIRDRTFAKVSLEDFRAVVEVNLMGAVYCSKAVWETMRRQKYGRIVLTSSSSGLWGNFGQTSYGAAKMALVGLMHTLGIEGERYGIRVNSLAPTAATAMTAGVLHGQEIVDLDPARVSPAVVFLASEHAPTRAIICAGAGSFERAYISVTQGAYLGTGPDVVDRLARDFERISNRTNDAVYADGAGQRAHEMAAMQRGAAAEGSADA